MDYNFLCGSSNMDDEQRLIAEPISFRNRGVSRKIYNDAFPKEDRMPFWLMPTMARAGRPRCTSTVTVTHTEAWIMWRHSTARRS